MVGRTQIEESEHYECCQVHSLSESGFASNQDEKWAKVTIEKTSDLKYPVKRSAKGHRTQNTKLYKDRTILNSPSEEL